MPEKVFIGFDPGLASCGYGVISARGSRVSHIIHGTIETSKSESDEQRLAQIHHQIQELFEQYSPCKAGVESIFFAKNISSAIPVAQARGVILLSCALHGIAVSSLSPQHIKQRISGIGRADKQQVQKMVQLILGMKQDIQSDHAADALAAAYCVSQESDKEYII